MRGGTAKGKVEVGRRGEGRGGGDTSQEVMAEVEIEPVEW